MCQGSDGDLGGLRPDLVHSAALLVGCDEKTVTRYVAVRDAGRDVGEWERRSRMIDPFLSKIEELVEASRAASALTWCTRSSRRWAFRALTPPLAALSPRRRRRIGTGTGESTGPGFPSRGCGCSSTGAKAPGLGVGAPSCSAPGCRGRWFRVVVPAWDQQLPTLIACLDTRAPDRWRTHLPAD